MMRGMIMLALLMLAACGADGAPSVATPAAPASGVSVTGDARMGVVVNPAFVEDGVTP